MLSLFLSMKQISNKINKQYILENISQVSIFSKYLDISETVILNCIETGNLIISPVRPLHDTDNNKSCGFKYDNRHKLKMRDFGGYFWGDCFDLVCLILNKSNNNNLSIEVPSNFVTILKHIAIQFSMAEGVPENITNIRENIYKVRSATKVIDLDIRQWNSIDKTIWIKKLHGLLSFKDLEEGYVYPIERFWVDQSSQPEAKYYHSNNDPCYAYYQGSYGGVNLIRLYFPLRGIKNNTKYGEPKFITNSPVIQGLMQFNGIYDIIIVTKSYKDILVLYKLIELSRFSFTGELRIGIIAYPSENYYMNDNLYNWLISHLKDKDSSNIYMFLDFEYVSRKSVKYVVDKYGINYMFLTNGMFGLPNYLAKDPTEFLENNGVQTCINLINNIYEKITNIN